MSKKVLFFNHSALPSAGPQLLVKEGYRVDMVHDPDAGLLRLGAQAYDLIIVQESHEAESWQLCERIRHLCPMPLIVINPSASTDTCINAIKAGADYFLRRPFGPLEFLARVQSLLRRTPTDQTAPVGS